MPRKLAATVHVTDDQGVVHTYGPGDDVPPEHAEKVTNESAWAEDEEPAPFDPAGTENTPIEVADAEPEQVAAQASETDTAEATRGQAEGEGQPDDGEKGLPAGDTAAAGTPRARRTSRGL